MYPITSAAIHKKQVIDAQIHQIMHKFYYLTDVPIGFLQSDDGLSHYFPTSHYASEAESSTLIPFFADHLSTLKRPKCCHQPKTHAVTLSGFFQFHLLPVFDDHTYMGAFVIGPTLSTKVLSHTELHGHFLSPFAVYKPEPKDIYTANLIEMLVENAIIHLATDKRFVNSLADRGILGSTHAHLQLIADLVLQEEKQEALTLYRKFILLNDEPFFLKQRLLTLETLISSRLVSVHDAPHQVLSAKNHFFVQLMKAVSTNCLAKLGENIIKVYTEFKRSQSLSGKSPAVRKAILYIKEHFQSPIKLSDVADYVKLSSAYLSSHFSSEMEGITLVDFIRLTRIQYSQRLLIYTQMPICEIAKDSGFENQHYFSTVFKTIVGVCPKRYRDGSFHVPVTHL